MKSTFSRLGMVDFVIFGWLGLPTNKLRAVQGGLCRWIDRVGLWELRMGVESSS